MRLEQEQRGCESMSGNKRADEPIIVKKYANRRLYNTATSNYITLDDLATMVRNNVDFQVIDAKSGEDITRSILTQIIMEREARNESVLPLNLLRQLIGAYGNSMQNLLPSYLEASMNNFRENQSKIREMFEKGIGKTPLAKIHEANMAMMRAASEVWMNGARKNAPEKQHQRAEGQDDAKRDELSEIAALRKQMEEMQQKLDKLSK